MTPPKFKLSDDLETFVERTLSEGVYADFDELLAAALTALQMQLAMGQRPEEVVPLKAIPAQLAPEPQGFDSTDFMAGLVEKIKEKKREEWKAFKESQRPQRPH